MLCAKYWTIWKWNLWKQLNDPPTIDFNWDLIMWCQQKREFDFRGMLIMWMWMNGPLEVMGRALVPVYPKILILYCANQVLSNQCINLRCLACVEQKRGFVIKAMVSFHYCSTTQSFCRTYIFSVQYYSSKKAHAFL